MSCSRKNLSVNYYYNINGTAICRCNEFVDVGVTMDTKLTLFVPHIVSVTNSALKTLGFIIRNSRDFKDRHCTKLLF